MQSIAVYRCLCDETRLRILNLLLEGPLCVCHLAAILEMDQPKISRHLKALKATGMVATERCHNWTICRISTRPHPVLDANLKCLQDVRGEEACFKTDLKRRQRIIRRLAAPECDDLPTPIRQLCRARGLC